MNNLTKFDRHQELGYIETFASTLDRAFAEFQDHLFGSPVIPEWRRIEVAVDGIMTELVDAFDNPTGRRADALRQTGANHSREAAADQPKHP